MQGTDEMLINYQTDPRGRKLLRLPPQTTWSISVLEAICQRKNIEYEETDAYTNLRGVVVSCGQSSIISIRASLPEVEKIFVIAHELAHIALGHTQPASMGFLREERILALPSHQDPVKEAKEQEANTWAAHLLVRPEVYEQCVQEARGTAHDEASIQQYAVERTAAMLKIPAYAVELWLASREVAQHFPEDPRQWLEHP